MPQSLTAMAIHVFGLTGGIATGKSTVAAHWQQLGLPVADADQLAREVVAPGTRGLDAAVNLFGPEALLPDGSLNRAWVGSRVFADPASRRALEAIVHPLVSEALADRALAYEGQGEPLLCYEAPLLIETGRARDYQPLVLVVAHEAAQIERVTLRDHKSESDARARMAAQLPLSKKAAQADLVILNDGTLEQLRTQANSTLAEVCRRVSVDSLRYRVR